MKQKSRRAWTGLVLLAAGVGALALIGCSGASGGDGARAAVGQMNLPLTTQGSSGTTYRLRNATFVIRPQYYDYEEAGAGGSSSVSTVSSETDPNAKNISVSVPEGYYYVQLSSGWSMEKVTSAGAQTVEATLLSGASQWVYVSRRSTSWAEYSFGIGSKEIWLNGKLNIAIDVQETADNAGAGGEGPIEIIEEGGSAG